MPSSVIRWFKYDPDKRELHIVFQSGRHYTYREVPAKIYLGLKAAFSKGEYFNAHIKDQFRFIPE